MHDDATDLTALERSVADFAYMYFSCQNKNKFDKLFLTTLHSLDNNAVLDMKGHKDSLTSILIKITEHIIDFNFLKKGEEIILRVVKFSVTLILSP